MDYRVANKLSMTDQAQKMSPFQLDYWIVGQLRGQVLRDLEAFVPDSYFDQKTLTVYASGDPSAKHLNNDLQWGQNAGNLGRKLAFETPAALSARQIAASEVLMHLGLLAAAKAAFEISKHLEQSAVQTGRSVENPNLKQLPQTISLFENNLQAALFQYFLYLSQEGAAPFLSLLTDLQLDDFLRTRDRYMTNRNITINGNVGAVQTGEHAVAHINQNWTTVGRERLDSALSALSDGIDSVEAHELSVQRKKEVKEEVERILAELKSSQPADQPSIAGKIRGLLAAIQTIESLKSVTELVMSAIEVLG